MLSDRMNAAPAGEATGEESTLRRMNDRLRPELRRTARVEALFVTTVLPLPAAPALTHDPRVMPDWTW